ncbi:hypothetical protein V6N13_055634 [Hibiscus sabdariffa]|uniref:Uncharacterized protein n=2 Tax=Hibiscus sabdariffa TaxID=183260 RepID=A0ABR2BMC1_9ROSI
MINSPCMAWKVPHLLIFTILCFSLLLLLLHGFHLLNFNINTKQAYHPNLSSRKAVATKFDFTPHHDHQAQDQMRKPADNEVDPRYGVEKRLVPTGPNPLHH